MIKTLERLPNEILLMIFSNLSWVELLISLWPLNKRFDILIHSVLLNIDNEYNNKFIINEASLSFNKISSLLPGVQ